jgi:aryl-alcohol dehydrogenase-like predicted oxidoreductase
LTGKYRRGEQPPQGTRLGSRGRIADDRTFERLEALEALARRRGAEMLDVAFGWLISRPAIASVIAGATKPEQIRANVRAARWTPSDADLAAIDEIVPPPSATPLPRAGSS